MDVGPVMEAVGGDVKSLGTLLREAGKQRRKVQVAAAVTRKALEGFERCYVLIGATRSRPTAWRVSTPKPSARVRRAAGEGRP